MEIRGKYTLGATMNDFITLIVINNDDLTQKLLSILDLRKIKSIIVKNINDALPLLKEKQGEIATVVCDIPIDDNHFEADLTRLKNNKEAKYVPFIGINRSNKFDPPVSRQLFFHILATPRAGSNLIHTIISAQSDYKRYLVLLSEVKSRTSAIGLIRSGTFRLQTLQQADALTTMLSLASPEPAIVALGLSELLVNAIEHGNLNISYAEKSDLLESGEWENEINNRLASLAYKDKYVEITFERTDDKITLIITDQGLGFDWKKYITPDMGDITDKHGRGIALANAMSFSEIHYNEKGNKVTATIDL